MENIHESFLYWFATSVV